MIRQTVTSSILMLGSILAGAWIAKPADKHDKPDEAIAEGTFLANASNSVDITTPNDSRGVTFISSYSSPVITRRTNDIYSVIEIYGEWPGEPMVIINSDGTVELNSLYDPNEGALIFWDALADTMPCR